jgi:hypothetical protein
MQRAARVVKIRSCRRPTHRTSCGPPSPLSRGGMQIAPRERDHVPSLLRGGEKKASQKVRYCARAGLLSRNCGLLGAFFPSGFGSQQTLQINEPALSWLRP